MRLTQAKCSSDKNLHQLPLSPVGVLWLPLPGCKHSFSEHFNHPLPTCPSTLVQVTPIFFHSGHPCMRERGGLKVYLFLMETLWESSQEDHHFSNPVPLSVPIISSHSNRNKCADWGSIWLQPCLETITNSYSGWGSAWMTVGPSMGRSCQESQGSVDQDDSGAGGPVHKDDLGIRGPVD